VTVSELTFLTIAEAARLIASRKLSPVELTEAYLARIAAFDHLLDSFVTLTGELREPRPRRQRLLSSPAGRSVACTESPTA